MPGNIRKAEHFVAFLKRFVEYLKVTRGILIPWFITCSSLVSEDSDACSTCGGGNTAIIPTAFEGYYIYRTQATKVEHMSES